jgi:RHS repeat-associated protein
LVKDGTTYRILSDQAGSVRLVVNASTGAIAQRINYDAFGVVTLDTNPGFQPFGFAGGLADLDTGLVRFGARDYDPRVGRWTSKDPLGLSGGMNVFEYAAGDPVNFIDPTGLLLAASQAWASSLMSFGANALDAAAGALSDLYCWSTAGLMAFIDIAMGRSPVNEMSVYASMTLGGSLTFGASAVATQAAMAATASSSGAMAGATAAAGLGMALVLASSGFYLTAVATSNAQELLNRELGWNLATFINTPSPVQSWVPNLAGAAPGERR